MSEPESAYLTIAQAATHLGISERQARRYAGRLAPDDRREAGHTTGVLVRLAAIQNEREKATKYAQTDVRPDAPTHEAGHEPDATPDMRPDTQDGEVLALLKSENAFLRGMVEQHQRSEAELRAALRKALDAMPKAITSGDSGSTPTSAADGQQSARSGATEANGSTTTNIAQRRIRRTPRPLWQVILGIRPKETK